MYVLSWEPILIVTSVLIAANTCTSLTVVLVLKYNLYFYDFSVVLHCFIMYNKNYTLQ